MGQRIYDVMIYAATGKACNRDIQRTYTVYRTLANYYTTKATRKRRELEILAVLSRFDERGEYHG